MMMNMKNQQQQCHLYAQKLNNRAALCIEIGHYDRAIASLAKALRLSAGNNHSSSDQHQHQRQHPHQEEERQQYQHRPQPVCRCNYCSLDGCIAYSESISATEELTKQMAKKNIKIASSKSSSTSTSSSTDGSSTTKSSFLSQHNKSFLSQQKQQQQHKKNKEKDNDNNTHDLTSNNNNSLLSNDKIYGSCDSYIYRRPIRITSRTIQEGHNMGSTLFLIITFNLALAHHLSAVDSDAVDADADADADAAVDNNNSSSTDSTTTSCSCNENNRIKKTLQLYEISNKWHIQSSNCHLYNDGDDDSGRYNRSTMMTQHEQQQQLNRDEYDSSEEEEEEEQQQQPDDDASTSTSTTSRNVSSIRFNMIICNNLSHIHCLVSNHSKHKQCLEHLLSQVMVALEYKTRTTSSPPSSNNDQHQDYGAAAAAAAAATEDYTLQMDLDGFLQSASSLILQEKCAKAA